MKHAIFLLLIFLNGFILNGQIVSNKNILLVEQLIKEGDSIKKADKQNAVKVFNRALNIALDNDLNQEAAIIYKKLGVISHIKKDYVKAEYLYKNGLKMDSLSAVSADLLYNISIIKGALNEQDSALYYLRRSVELYEKFELNDSAYKAFLRAGIMCKDLQLHEESLTYLIKAYHGFEKSKNHKKLADVCITIGNLQNQIKNYNQALEYHQQALALYKSLGNVKSLSMCYTNIGNVYKDLKENDSTIINYERAIEFADKNSKQYAILLNNLGNVYKDIKAFGMAKDYYEEAIVLNQSLKDSTSLMYNYNGLVSLFLETNDISNAKIYIDKSQKMLSSIRDNLILLSFYENEVEFYKKSKDYKKALESQINHSNLYKQIFNAENTEIVQQLQEQFESEKKENEILRLRLSNKTNELLLSEKGKSIKNKNIFIIVLASLILILVLFYFVFAQRQKANRQAIKIEKLEATYQGQETIKKRIARDLHDIITTNIDGLRLRILALKRSSNINDMVDEITKDLKRMNVQIRTVSHRLYPLEMYMGNQKFTSVINSRLSEFQLYSKIFVELDNPIPEVLNDLKLSVQNNFYGILLEVLNNVEKHSMAKKIVISNFMKNERLHFIFEDNGIGINDKHKEGIGLLNIKQRIEIIEGQCAIQKTETGTRVHIHFPINH